MYDKEYSTGKEGNSETGHTSYYGDHKKDAKYGLDAHKQYGHKKYGNKDGHADYAYGKLEHSLGSHSDDGIHKHIDHAHHYPPHYSGATAYGIEPHYVTSAHQYHPIDSNYGGALNGVTYSSSSLPYADDLHLDDHQQHHLPSTNSESVYVPNEGIEHDSVNSKLKSLRHVIGSDGQKSNIAAIPLGRSSNNVIPIIKSSTVTTTTKPSLSFTTSERVISAVHATPAVINTHTGAHYYSS